MQPADVACFKSLKVIWKKVVEECRGEAINKAVTKAVFGELMEKSSATLSSTTIINGFTEQCNFSMEPRLC